MKKKILALSLALPMLLASGAQGAMFPSSFSSRSGDPSFAHPFLHRSSRPPFGQGLFGSGFFQPGSLWSTRDRTPRDFRGTSCPQSQSGLPPWMTPPQGGQSPSFTPPAPSSPGQASSSLDQLRQRILDLVNSARAQAGLPPLQMNAALQAAAQEHSEDMLQNNYFDHTSRDGLSPMQRMQSAGYNGTSYGENIAEGQQSPEKVMNDWMNSPEHRQNILSPNYGEIGIGIAGNVWTQDFGGR